MRLSFVAVVAGALLLAIVTIGAVAPPAQAQELPPRPLTPTTTPTSPPIEEAEEERPSPRRLAPGRLTGTVIDVATGAPAANIAVRIGPRIVVSDANGNYDWSGLPAGSYEVALVLPADWGVAVQGTLTAEVPPGQTVVQHLFYRSS